MTLAERRPSLSGLSDASSSPMTDPPRDYLAPITERIGEGERGLIEIQGEHRTRIDRPEIAEEDRLQRWLRSQRSRNEATIERAVTLRVVLGRLEGVPFEEAAALIGTSEKRLVAWIQETEPIPRTKEQRLRDLVIALDHLHQLVPRENTRAWLHLSIPALKGDTPLEAAVKGRFRRLIEVAMSYADPSFA